MRLPVRVDVARHLQHPSSDDLGVDRVIREVLRVVAIRAPLLRSDPLRHRGHRPRELADALVAQHLHVLEDEAGTRSVLRCRRLRGRHRVDRRLLGQQPRVVDLDHAGAAIPVLHGDDRWPLAARDAPAKHRARRMTRFAFIARLRSVARGRPPDLAWPPVRPASAEAGAGSGVVGAAAALPDGKAFNTGSAGSTTVPNTVG